MLDLAMSPDNKFLVSLTNNNQVVLLDSLTNQYKVIQSPTSEPVIGCVALLSKFIVFSPSCWQVYNINGELEQEHVELELGGEKIVGMFFTSLTVYHMVCVAKGEQEFIAIRSRLETIDDSLYIQVAFAFNCSYTKIFFLEDDPQTVKVACLSEVNYKSFSTHQTNSLVRMENFSVCCVKTEEQASDALLGG